jgi:hypothetical protein
MTTQLERFLAYLPPRLRVRRVNVYLEPAPSVRRLVPLRKAGCTRLEVCEDTWIAWNGDAPARCPERCRAYRPAAGAVR